MKVKVVFEVAKVTDGYPTQIDVVFDVIDKGMLDDYCIFTDGFLPVGSGKSVYDLLVMKPRSDWVGHTHLRVGFPTFAQAHSFGANMAYAIRDGYRIYKRLISEKALMDDVSVNNFLIDTEQPGTPVAGSPPLSDPEKRIKATGRIYRELGDVISESLQEIIENIKDSDRLRSTWLCMEDQKRKELFQAWYMILSKNLEPYVSSVVCQIADIPIVHIPINVVSEDKKADMEAHFNEAMKQCVREISWNIDGSDKNWSHGTLVTAWKSLTDDERDEAHQIWNKILVKNLEHPIAFYMPE